MQEKFLTLNELAALYGISKDTLKRRINIIENQLKIIGEDDNGDYIFNQQNIRLYSPKQLKIIYKLLGEPETSKNKNL